ncbi:hypothetical protein EB001_25330 [bacterium]|nr:hypothetical protein [bacterium]
MIKWALTKDNLPMFLRYQTEIAGMPVELIKSTTKLTTSEMTEYQQQIEVWGQTMGWGWDY